MVSLVFSMVNGDKLYSNYMNKDDSAYRDW